MEKYAYQKTKYPEIYKNIYWGRFKEDDGILNDEMFSNRNILIEEFDITRTLPDDYGFSQIGLDHTEVYESKDKKIIAVYSNYIENTFAHSGFKNYLSIYSPRAKTCIKVFKDIEKFQRYVKARLK